MSKPIEINLKPDVRTLRQFGFIALAGFAFLAVIAWYEALVFSFGLGAARSYVAGGFAAVAGLSLLLSLIYPRANLGLLQTVLSRAWRDQQERVMTDQ